MDEAELKKKLEAVAAQGKAKPAGGGPEMEAKFAPFDAKMRKEGLNEAAIAAFKYNYGVLVSGASTMIPESALNPVDTLPELESMTVNLKPELLQKTVVLKLNGD